MNISVAGQTLDFLYSALLGVFLSISYDLFKVLRLRAKYFTALFDALFCVVAAAALFLFFMTIGGGEIRIYYFIGIFGGGIIYFMTLSNIVLALGGALADFISLVVTAVIAPLALIIHLIKKFLEILRNIFKYSLKWYKIERTNKSMRGVKARSADIVDGGGRIEKKKSRIADKNSSTVLGNLRRSEPYISPEANP